MPVAVPDELLVERVVQIEGRTFPELFLDGPEDANRSDRIVDPSGH